MVGSRVASRALVLLVVVLGPLLLLSGSGAAWSASVTPLTATGQAGGANTISVQIQNTDTQTIGFYSVYVRFDWESSGTRNYLHQSSTPSAIPIGTAGYYTGTVNIPAGTALGPHTVTIVSEGAQLSGTSWVGSHTHTRTATFEIVPGTPSPIAGTFPTGLLVAIGIVIVVVIVALVVLSMFFQRSRPVPAMAGSVYTPAPFSPAPASASVTAVAPPRVPAASAACPKCGSPATGGFCGSCGNPLT